MTDKKNSKHSESSESSKPSIHSPKRKIYADKPRFAVKRPDTYASATTVIPNIDTLMNDALSIIASELHKYRHKTSGTSVLDLKEARALQGYMETLVKLSKENREQARADDLANLTDEELAQLASQVLKLPPQDSAKKLESVQNLDSAEKPDSALSAEKPESAINAEKPKNTFTPSANYTSDEEQ